MATFYISTAVEQNTHFKNSQLTQLKNYRKTLLNNTLLTILHLSRRQLKQTSHKIWPDLDLKYGQPIMTRSKFDRTDRRSTLVIKYLLCAAHMSFGARYDLLSSWQGLVRSRLHYLWENNILLRKPINCFFRPPYVGYVRNSNIHLWFWSV